VGEGIFTIRKKKSKHADLSENPKGAGESEGNFKGNGDLIKDCYQVLFVARS